MFEAAIKNMDVQKLGRIRNGIREVIYIGLIIGLCVIALGFVAMVSA
jgi:hypothetical protein